MLEVINKIIISLSKNSAYRSIDIVIEMIIFIFIL